MTEPWTLLGIGTGAFVASNIDDTFMLMLLFSSTNILTRDVTIGQFLGIALLVVVSASAALLILVVPLFVIGLMGFIPIGIGVKRLIEYQQKSKTNKQNKKLESLSFLSVAGITIANGGDDLGVFTPLFAKYNTYFEVTILMILFMLLTGIWCTLTYYFIRRPLMASRMSYLSQIINPFVLLGLGVYILFDSFVL
ncbi:MAG TPA: cadmium resistance transporter [Nitrososphaeraceae archaeon]|nr:cadmium resistance transporter [Nitrososphaeraceae archaeon]